jgi:biopolymer transport protein TolR
MSPSSRASSSAVRSDINVTPMVDVCLVLLIIFMVVMPVIQAGVKVELPKTGAGPIAGEQTQIPVSIAEDGGIYVRNTRVADADLSDTLAVLHEAEPEHEVIVRGDRRLQYEKVSEVLTLINQAGFTRVGLITEKRQPPAGS